MHKKLLYVLAFAAIAPSISAQSPVSVTFDNGGSTTDGQYYIGNYNAHIDGAPAVVNCVDFFHDVSNGQTWQAYESVLTGDLSKTRLGLAGNPNAATTYKEGAWLISHYNGADQTTLADLQHAVWGLFGAAYNNPSSANYFFTGPGNTLSAGALSWLNLASTNWNDGSVDYSGYAVITDVNAGGRLDAQSAQEFITTTPEPTTMALLGTGLVGLVPLVRRRKQSS